MSAPEWRLTLELLKRLATPKGREVTGLFSSEGVRSMERVLRSQLPVKEVLVSEPFAISTATRNQEVLKQIRGANIPLRIAPDSEMAELTRGRGLGDVFAVMNQPDPGPWESWIQPEGRTLWIVGWNISDPGNTGAVIRSALASGAAGFIAVGTTDPWHPKSVRTSMGSLFKLPVRRVADDSEWLQVCRKLGFETVGSVCRDAEALPDFTPSGTRTALVMGSEAFGIPDELIAGLDRRVCIPMPEGVDSYSVNAATAILAYHLTRV